MIRFDFMTLIYCIRILCKFVFVFVVFAMGVASFANSTIPYIYYYSYDEQAFIMQRADGTDHSILTAYQVSEPYMQIVGTGWSPSGRWFTWMNQGTGGGSGANNVYVVGREGQTTQTIFPNRVATVFEATWSPQGNFLLIRLGETHAVVQNIVVYDPTSQQIVFELRGVELNPIVLETVFSAKWSPDGSKLAIIDFVSRQLFLIDSTTFEVMRTIPASTSPTFDGVFPYWLTDTQLLYLSTEQNNLLIHDLVNEEIISVALPADQRVLEIIASQEDSSILFYTYIPPQPPNHATYFSLWMLSVNDGQLTLVEEDVDYSLPVNRPIQQTSREGWFFRADPEFDVSLIEIVNPTLGIQQELGFCPADSQSCYGWLPEISLDHVP